MSNFQINELVDVTIKGVRIARPRSATSVTITDEHGTAYQMPPQAAIERVAPAEWPPHPGDLWRDKHGDLWFIFTTPTRAEDEPELMARTADGLRWTENALALVDDNAPLTLVHREDATPCGCDHHGDHLGCDADCECAR